MKKKKGSSLIFVLVTLMVMVTFGFSILSLTLMSYKKRFTEANEKRNQYFSEAGIDIAYGVVGKTVDKAVKEGDKAVNDAIVKINQAVKSELSDDDNKKYKAYLNSDGGLNKDKINKEIFLPAYKTYIEQNLAPNILDRSLYDVGEGQSGKPYDKPVVTVVDKDGNELPGETTNPQGVKLSFKDDGDKNDDTLSVHLRSEFSSNKASDTVSSGQIHKVISVNYVIGPSKYSKPTTQKVQVVEVPSEIPVWQKVICTDSNFIVKSDMTIKGDVYSKGSNNGGIDIQGGNFNVSGIVTTNCNFIVSGSVRQAAVALNGNLYAGNITLLGSNTVFNLNPYNDRNLLGAIYTNNDFEIFGNGGNVNINGSFYGLNDKNEETTYPGQSKPPVSSCILINAASPPNFKINDQAVLMGVGYVKTNPQYETGESVAIKGNYKAYTKALKKEKFNDENVVFEYMPPLTLAKGIYQNGSVKEMLLQDKSEYIKAYDEENKDLNKSNVNLNTNGSNIISAGTFISNGNMYAGNYTDDYQGFIRNKQIKYSRAVYGMESIADSTDENDFEFELKFDEKNPEKDPRKMALNNYQSNLAGISDNNVTVAKEMNFTKISSHVNKTVKHSGSGDTNVIYLDGDENNDCYLIGHDGVKPSVQDANIIDLEKNNIKGGVIITKGKVHIRGTISDFKGTIIAEGDITDEDGKNPKNFSYDESYIREIVGDNADNFNGLINSSSSDKNIYTNVSNNDSNVGTDVIRDASQIKMLNWRIIK